MRKSNTPVFFVFFYAEQVLSTLILTLLFTVFFFVFVYIGIYILNVVWE